jgi:signal transduction histidine kinase
MPIRPALNARHWLLALAAAWLGTLAAAPASAAELLTLAEAERIDARGAQRVTLPDRVVDPVGGPALRYRWTLDLEAPQAPTARALYFSGLRAWGRLSVNGRTLFDHADRHAEPSPSGLTRLVRVDVPAELWQPGRNVIEFEAPPQELVWVSPLEVGPRAELARRERWHAIGTVYGPALVATALGALGLAMLWLWRRQRDALYLRFGLGVSGWALHTGWTVLPSPLLGPPHYAVWWNTLYGAFVGMLVLFCLRLAGWHWPRFERALLAWLVATPLLLYAALWSDPASAATSVWRLSLVLLAAVAAAALVLATRRGAARERRQLALVGLVSLGAAVHDWWVGQGSGDNNPVFLVPYVGLAFAAFVVGVLIERFLEATRGLQRLNVELEQRVAAQNAELREALEQMRGARDAAEAADQAKTRFLAAASHDLRQPAHALGLYMSALRAGPLAPEQSEIAERMAASLAALETMFGRLLDVSRIDAGAVQPHWDLVPLAPLLRRLADEWAADAEARGLRLVVRIADPGAMTVTDPLLLERVLRNLLANAVKYTRQGGVLLACRTRHGADGRPQLRLEVWDSGVGIAPADQERVFEEFYQVGNPGRSRSGGMGLGLAIVRGLVRVLGLRLVLRSRPGRGSVFMLEGLVPSGAVPQAAAASRAALRRLAGARVALLEDDEEVRDATRRLLQSWGCQVIEGADADTLLALAEPGALPQALIADIRLAGGREGPQEAERLMAAWGLRLPLLLVSGESAGSAFAAARAAGQTCLTKPVSPARLRAWLEQVLRAALREGAR